MRANTPYQLGVDIGTSSAAFYAFSLNQRGKPEKYLFHDLMLFGEPVVGEKSVLKSVARREARGARRRTQRRANRLKKLGYLAQKLGVTQQMQSTALCEVTHDSSGIYKLHNLERLWEVRANAAREKVSLPLLFCILQQMAKIRGVSFDVPKTDNKVLIKLRERNDLSPSERKKSKSQLCIATYWKELHPDLTVAEILVKKRISKEIFSLGNRKKKTGQEKKNEETKGLVQYNNESFLFHRNDYKSELSLILEEQSKHHPVLNGALLDFYSDEQKEQILEGKRNYFWGDAKQTIKEALFQIVFYQYPLKGFEHLIAPCSLEPENPDKPYRRLVACHPAANRFLTLKTAFDLRWKQQRKSVNLTAEQISLFLKMSTQPELFHLSPNAKGKVDVDDFYQILDDHGYPKPEGWVLSLETTRCRKLSVNMLSSAMEGLGVRSLFETLTDQQKELLIQYWGDVISSNDTWFASGLRERLANDHPSIYTEVLDILDAINDKNESIPSLKSIGVAAHRIQFGQLACEKMFETMWSKKIAEHEAKDVLYPKRDSEDVVNFNLLSRREIQTIIPMVVSPNEPSSHHESVEITNPTVRRAVQEVRKRLVERVYQYGPPEKVIIEMAREVKQNKKQRDHESKRQAQMDNLSLAASNKLKELNLKITPGNIRRIILLWEQGRECPYSGQEITERDAVNGVKCHEEHIIPKNMIHRANSRRFIVLSKASVNLEKGNHPTVHQYFVAKNNESGFSEMKIRLEKLVKKFPSSTPELDICKTAFESKMKLLLREKPYGEDFDDEEFCDRQLAETSYIGRVIVKLFSSVCTDVFGSRGPVTSLIRGENILDLISVLKEICTKEGKLDLIPKISNKEKKAIEASEKKIQKFKKEGDDENTPRMKTEQEKLERLKTPLGVFYKRDKQGTDYFDKRSDHRHHIVDACAIALSDRSLSKCVLEHQIRLARQGATLKDSNSYEEIRLKLPLNVRKDLLEVIEGHVPVPKPDRLYNGALFKLNPVATQNTKNPSDIEYGTTVSKLDSKGNTHHHRYENDGYCCALINNKEPNKSRIITLYEYLKSSELQALCKKPTDDEFLLFKGDMIANKSSLDRRFYAVQQILKRDGGTICLLESSISADFNQFDTSYSKNPFNVRVSISSFSKKFIVIRSSFVRRKIHTKKNNKEQAPLQNCVIKYSCIPNSQQGELDLGS